MINVTILAFGSIKNKSISTLVSDYQARIVPFGKVKIEELSAEKFTATNHDQVKALEERRLTQYLAKRTEARIILLDERGSTPNSQDFAKLVAKEVKPIIFVIGASLGFSDFIKAKFREHISLSCLTLPHELARLVLIEQLYRAITIDIQKPYHY